MSTGMLPGEFVINSSSFFFACPLKFCALCSHFGRSFSTDQLYWTSINPHH